MCRTIEIGGPSKGPKASCQISPLPHFSVSNFTTHFTTGGDLLRVCRGGEEGSRRTRQTQVSAAFVLTVVDVGRSVDTRLGGGWGLAFGRLSGATLLTRGQ